MQSLGFMYTDPFSANESTASEAPKDLTRLASTISTCHLCDLSKSRTQSMSGSGSSQAKVMFVDFTVSSSDDNNNGYFTGRSGDTLKKMIQNVLELDTQEVFYTHSVKCKPLNSNMPSPSECDSCKPYLFWQIDFIKPQIIVTLGDNAYYNLTDETDNFEDVRGHVIDFKKYKLIPIYHPQYLLRNPELKKIALKDLKTIKSCI